MRFLQQFNSTVCVGDQITADITDKIRLVATVRFDETTRPEDFNCYAEADVERWKNDEWFFCGVVLSLQSHDGTIYVAIDSLWGIEANFGKDNAYLAEVANELLDDSAILAALHGIYKPAMAAVQVVEATRSWA